MTEHHFAVRRTARYYQLGELRPATRELWVVCHGYGQLASYFSRHFAFLVENDPQTVVVAPEGLSRFYLNGTSGRVGASWMTREDRLTEIQDHIAFLNQLLDSLLTQCAADVKITVLGFSQGTATISRWLVQPGRHWPLHKLVLWAGSFPEDIAPDAAQALLSAQPVTLVCGRQDEYISPEKLLQQADTLRHLGASLSLRQFDGGHELNREVLQQLANK
ncbi:esterase [Hymenobacter saemangeumensis]|uniref:Esterase n=1 Tax=Hymenobacter saemangeumensis TaxID=1084522 RepID=A0ABP8I2R1_9BACT